MISGRIFFATSILIGFLCISSVLGQVETVNDCGWSQGCNITANETILNPAAWSVLQMIHRPHYYSKIIINFIAKEPKDALQVEAHIMNNENIIDKSVPQENSKVPFSVDLNTGYAWAEADFSSFATPLNVVVSFRVKQGGPTIILRSWSIAYEPANPSGGKTFGIMFGLIMLCLLPIGITLVTFYLEAKNGAPLEPVGPHRYPLIPPQPIEPLLGKTEFFKSIWTQPIHGFRIYNLNHHDIAWIWFPADNEVLTRNRRILCTGFVLWFVFLFQFYWNDFATLWADGVANERLILAGPEKSFFAHSFLAFLLRFLMTDLIAFCFRIIGKRIFQFLQLHPAKVQWANHEDPKFLWGGRVLNYGGIFALAFIWIFLFVRLFIDEKHETFGYVLVWSVGPFLAALSWRALGFYLVFSYLMYRIKCTWGEAWVPSESSDTISLIHEQNRDAGEDRPLFGNKSYGTENNDYVL